MNLKGCHTIQAQRNARIKKLTEHIETTYMSIKVKEFRNVFKIKKESTNN
jgi:hypothetical protein